MRLLTKASCLPFGEKQGFVSVPGWTDNRLAFPPETGAIQMSPLYENATIRPFGETAGDEANLISPATPNVVPPAAMVKTANTATTRPQTIHANRI